MFKIKTATGRELDCDMAVVNPDPPRLYLNIRNTSLSEMMQVFSNPTELPVEGYPKFGSLQSVSDAYDAVSVALKP